MIEDIKQYKITYTIIFLNIIIYIISAINSSDFVDIKISTLGEMGAMYGPLVVLGDEWWRLFTAMFLHGGITHILMNMFSLYLIGRGAETYFDTKSYLSIYLFSGLIGGLVSIYMHPISVGVGASGAIFGIFGALAGFFLANRAIIASHTKEFMKSFAIIIGINLVIGFSIESVDVSAHVGGLIIGFIGGFMLSKNPKNIWIYGILMMIVIFAFALYLPSQYDQFIS